MKTTVIARTIMGEKREVLVKDLNFRVGVYGILIKDDKILLSPWRDGWDFPGGGMNIDETIEQTLVREVREETGLDVKQGLLVDVSNEFYIGADEKNPRNSIGIYYLCNDIKGDISIDGFTELEKKYSGLPKWFDIEEAKKVKFYNTLVSGAETIYKAVRLTKDRII